MSGKSSRSALTCLLLIGLSVVLASSVCADAKTDPAGAWAMQFQINDNFSLGAFQGSTLSLKKHKSSGFAWRLGLDISLEFNDDESQDFREDSLQTKTESSVNIQDIQLRIQALFYPNSFAGIKFFYGFGPLIGFAHGRNNTDQLRISYERLLSNEASFNKWEIGASGVFGVEWFASGNISLIAEYSTMAYYRYHKSTNETISTYPDNISRSNRERIDKDLIFEADEVRFGLSVYF